MGREMTVSLHQIWGQHVHRLLRGTCGSRYPYLVCGAGGVGAVGW